jgi:hypothetical protein
VSREIISPVYLGNNSIIYNATWQSPVALIAGKEFGSISNTSDTSNPFIHNMCGNFTFSVATISPTSIDVDNAIAHNKITSCIPRRANYTVVVSYKDGIQSIKPTLGSVQPIHDLIASDTPQGGTKNISGFYTGDVEDPQVETGTTPLNWTPELLSWYRNLNIIAIIDALTVPLSGTYTSASAIMGPPIDSDDPNAKNASYPIAWLEWLTDPSITKSGEDCN